MARATLDIVGKLNQVLAAQGRKQTWLAQQLGVDPAVVSRWVNGHFTPRKATQIKISKLLGVPPEELFPVPSRKETA